MGYVYSVVMVGWLCNTHKASAVYLRHVPLRNTPLRGIVSPKQQNEGLACRGIGWRTNILQDCCTYYQDWPLKYSSPKFRRFFQQPLGHIAFAGA